MVRLLGRLRTPEDRELVRSMIDLIHRFGMKSVAEGVETMEQFQVLGEMGRDVVQGYLVVRLWQSRAGR